MAKYRFEFDAIIVVAGDNPDEALETAKKFVSNLDADPALDAIGYGIGDPLPRVQIIGEDACPTTLILTGDGDIDNTDGELRVDEIHQLEEGEVPDSMREEDEDNA